MLERRLADREEVKWVALCAVCGANTKAGVRQRHGILIAIENRKIDRPDPIGCGIYGVTVAEFEHIIRLAWL
jgi:hypothetical protein